MARSPLDRIEIASPCTADWDAMKGDDTRRHCAECDLDVFDLSAMTRTQAEALLRTSGSGRLCARLYRRPDGTVITADCPVGRGVVGQRRSLLAAGLAGAASLLLGGGAGLLASARRLPLIDDVVVMGVMECPPPPADSPPEESTPPTGEGAWMGEVAWPAEARLGQVVVQPQQR